MLPPHASDAAAPQCARPAGARREMRRTLLHWEDALTLARTLAPAEVPAISRELGAQCEVRGEYEQALAM